MAILVQVVLLCTIIEVTFAAINWIPSTNPKCHGACPSNNEVNVHMPHIDCDKFCQCVWGKPYEMPCAPGTHFNPSLQVCDWPDNAGCTGNKEPSLKPNPPTNDTEGCIGNCPATNPPFPAWADYLPHKDCTKFCECNWGKPVAFNCPEGLHFNSKLNVCDWPEDAGCSGNKEPSQKPKPPTNITEGCIGKCPAANPSFPTWADYLPHQDCTKFCECNWGKPEVFSCPEGLHFNSKLHVCDWPPFAGCIDPQGCVGRCPKTNPFWADYLRHQDCTKFCQCNWGEFVVFNCSEGLHFNPDLNICDYPRNVGCSQV